MWKWWLLKCENVTAFKIWKCDRCRDDLRRWRMRRAWWPESGFIQRSDDDVHSHHGGSIDDDYDDAEYDFRTSCCFWHVGLISFHAVDRWIKKYKFHSWFIDPCHKKTLKNVNDVDAEYNLNTLCPDHRCKPEEVLWKAMWSRLSWRSFNCNLSINNVNIVYF